jgi:hypothetical protein
MHSENEKIIQANDHIEDIELINKNKLILEEND